MGNVVLSYNHGGRGAILGTVGTEVQTAPVSNLFLRHPGDVWQSPNLTVANTTFTLQLPDKPGGSTPSWNFVALLYSNATITDDWRIRAAATEAALTTSPTYDSGSINMYAGSVVPIIPWAGSLIRTVILGPLISTHTERWMHIEITSTAPEGFFRAGNLIIDSALQPSRNFQMPLEIGSPARINLDLLSELDAVQLDDAAQQNKGEAMFFVSDPEETNRLHNFSVWGLEQPGNGIRMTRPNLWAKRYVIDSFL